jgi:RNA polymerase sigma-70 factor, ECF subfamily
MDLFSFDDDYVRRLREGDRETEAHFYSYFHGLLYAKLRRRLHSMYAIEEVRQEVFLRTLAGLEQLADGRTLGGFVNSICNNVLKEYYRQESRAVSLEEQPEPAGTTDLDADFDSARNAARVRAVLDTLDRGDAEILSEVFLEDSDKEEICRRFGINRAYLRVLLHRAKAKFRAVFKRRHDKR